MTRTLWTGEHERITGHRTANGRCEECNAKPPMHEEDQ